MLILVCDSLGVGAAPDAAAYGDQGANTLSHVASAAGGLDAPNLEALGLGLLTSVEGLSTAARAGTAHGSLTERSQGKDSTTGHWELAGVVMDRPFPTYPQRFPEEVIRAFERGVGRPVLGNVPASGTEIIDRLGPDHLRTGRPIVYTSADSVFQVACHVDVVPTDQLYEWCQLARRILDGPHRVGRVIARPFTGTPGRFKRTPGRRDLTVTPPAPTVLDLLFGEGISVYGVGKVGDIFAGRGLTEFRYSSSNDEGIDITLDYLARPAPVFVMTNLVDFDSKFGHRNDPRGYAACLESLDRRLPELERAVGQGLMFVTGDHGCDPTTPSTDHTREYVPVLLSGVESAEPVDLGVRACFCDLGATASDALGVPPDGAQGDSFLAELRP